MQTLTDLRTADAIHKPVDEQVISSDTEMPLVLEML